MKIVMIGVAALFLTAIAQASEPSIPALRKQVADAQKQVDLAQQKFDQAKASNEPGVSLSEKSEKINDSRNELAKARARLDQAKNQLRVAQQKNKADDSSQAIQPENRTQNGANFSIRSQRDSENHPPLPASQ